VLEVNEKLDQFINSHLNDYIEELIRLCAQPSVSATREGIDACVPLVVEMLEGHGLNVQVIQTAGNPVVVGEARGASPRRLLFYNHYDVQPPEPLELWTTPPFEPTVRDGALYARGAEDDKGELVARLAALDAVRQVNGGELPCGVLFVVEGEEEVGSPNIVPFVRNHTEFLACDGSIWEVGGQTTAGAPETVLGVRGILGVELVVETLKRDAHSGNAHILPNAAWRLVRLLDGLLSPEGRIQIPGFYDAVVPPTPRELELSDALATDEDMYRELFGVERFVFGRSGKELNRATFLPTCNIQGITTGYQAKGMKTVIPARASVKLDFRLVPDQDPDTIYNLLREYLDAQGYGDVQIVGKSAMWPAKTSSEHPFVALTAKAGEEVYGKPEVIRPMGGGSSPIYAFDKPLGGIPVVLAGTAYWDNRAHSPDEHIRLRDFHNGARHIARILNGFADCFDYF
jgi:acetylornithine deacetylase/succinyl-diaminopimelate desuccinylase-like protein